MPQQKEVTEEVDLTKDDETTIEGHKTESQLSSLSQAYTHNEKVRYYFNTNILYSKNGFVIVGAR